MNKKIRNLVISGLITFSTVTVGFSSTKVKAMAAVIPKDAQLWCIKTNVPQNKEWTVFFNKPVDVNSLSKSVHVYDKDSRDLPLTIYVALDRKSIKIDAAPKEYQKNNTYDLYIEGVTSGDKVLKPMWMEFTISK